MAFSISGRIAAGADEGLQQVLDRRLKEAIRQQQERDQVEGRQLQREGLELQRQTLASAAADREADNLRQQQYFDLNKLRFDEERATRAKAEADKQTAKNAMSDMAAVLAMPGMTNEQKASEIAGSGIRTGTVDPQKVFESLTKIPEQYRYTYTDPKSGQRTLKTIGVNQIPAEGLDLGREPDKPPAPPRTVLTPGEKFNATRALRNDYLRETKSTRLISEQYANMKSSLDQIKKGDVPAASEALLVIFEKILDPTSVVRESEFARTQQGQAMLTRLQLQFQKISQGGYMVPAELEKYVTLAKQFTDNALATARDSERNIKAIATEHGLNADLITGAFDPAERLDQPGVAPATPGAAPAVPGAAPSAQDLINQARKQPGQ